MPKITIANEKKEIEVPAGTNLREALRRQGLEVNPGLARYFNCFGHGQCGTCKVLVKKGMEGLNSKTMMEKLSLFRMLSSIGQENEMRLACQCAVQGDVTIEIHPAMNLSGENFWQKPYPNK